ncbi:MAG: pantoate--beta-alanine ligase [Planctomycetes bacterium]|nr:pantoate--beta-alanine ligase [Planctomycetota bacterium]
METLATIAQLRTWRNARLGSVGFVPTMGALHEGHASLVRRSATENVDTVVSIFVNPTQFGPTEDLDKYPRTLQADLDLCRAAGASAVFTPDKLMMYPPGFATWVTVDRLTNKLCGKSRPDHFRGVTTVVTKLFNLVQPARAYFGQKDAQQALVLTRMAQELDMPLQVITCPIVREHDGLAMSSRNRYLSDADRQRAVALTQALQAIQAAFHGGQRDVVSLRQTGLAVLAPRVDRVDYLEILSAHDLAEIGRVESRALCAVAAFVGTTRLIDNVILEG